MPKGRLLFSKKFPDIIWLDPHAEGNAATVREMLER